MLRVTPKGTYVPGKVLYPPKLDRPFIFDEGLMRSRPADQSEYSNASYEINIIVENDVAKQLEAEMLKLFNEKFEKKKPKNLPIQYNDEADQWVFKAKIRGEYRGDIIPPIQLRDSQRKLLQDRVQIGVGSQVVVKVNPIAYATGAVSGVTARLKVVQIIKLVEDDEDHGFDVVDDGFIAATNSMVENKTVSDDDFDSDIPF